MRSWPAAFVWLCALLVVVALVRIVSTYHVFNQTWDEAAHIGGGMELLDRGTYTYEPMHPPLPRVMAALGPYLDGARSQGDRNRDIEGNRILHSLGTYDRTLALARLGILPFFILAAVVVALWARDLYGLGGALAALLLFTTLPPVLAHAGLATTDMAATGTIALALYLWSRWLDFPSAGRSAALGAALGLAVLSKLSALLFLPVGAVVVLAVGRSGGRAVGRSGGQAVGRSGGQAVARLIIYLATFLTIWAGYRFSVGPLVPSVPAWADAPSPSSPSSPSSPPSPPSPPSPTSLDRFVLRIERAPIYPAPELFQGFVALFKKNRYGHRGYLLGEVRATGWWYFFPVALAVKTPLGFLALFAVGLGALASGAVRRREWSRFAPGLVAVIFVLVAMSSGINIGLRHVLPAYPFMALAAGAGAVALWGWRRFRPFGPVAAALLAGWTVVSSARAHPDYLAYFNELAGSRPERILVDSDLDWGQDLDRLADTLQARSIREISIAYNGSADITRHGLPAFRQLQPFQPTAGWIAISLFCLKLGKVGTPTPDEFAWLEAFTPVARVGRSILLYHLTDAELPYHHPIGRPQ